MGTGASQEAASEDSEGPAPLFAWGYNLPGNADSESGPRPAGSGQRGAIRAQALEESMYWQKWSNRLKRELKLGMDPVAVTFGDAVEPGIPAPQAKLSVCQALKRAAEGESLTITAETCGCPGVDQPGAGTPAVGREREAGAPSG